MTELSIVDYQIMHLDETNAVVSTSFTSLT